MRHEPKLASRGGLKPSRLAGLGNEVSVRGRRIVHPQGLTADVPDFELIAAAIDGPHFDPRHLRDQLARKAVEGGRPQEHAGHQDEDRVRLRTSGVAQVERPVVLPGCMRLRIAGQCLVVDQDAGTRNREQAGEKCRNRRHPGIHRKGQALSAGKALSAAGRTLAYGKSGSQYLARVTDMAGSDGSQFVARSASERIRYEMHSCCHCRGDRCSRPSHE